EALRGLAMHVLRGETSGLTPSDLPAVNLTQAEVALIASACPDPADVLPLTPLQEGLLFHALYDEQSPDVYNVQLGLELAGPLDLTAMRRAADQLLERHPNLRAAFLHEGLPAPVQVVPRRVSAPFAVHDLGSADDPEAEAARLATADQVERFDLRRAPLVRFRLLRLGPERHRLLITNHHIITDGWSFPLIIKDLMALYGGQGEALPAGST